MSEMRVKFSQTFASNWRRFFFSSRSSFSFFFQILFLSVLFSAALFFIHSRSKVSLPSSSSTLPLHFDSSSSSFSFFFYVTYIFLFWNRVCNFKINKHILPMMLSENLYRILKYHRIISIYFIIGYLNKKQNRILEYDKFKLSIVVYISHVKTTSYIPDDIGLSFYPLPISVSFVHIAHSHSTL